MEDFKVIVKIVSVAMMMVGLVMVVRGFASSSDSHWDCVAKCEPYEIQYLNSKGDLCICEEAWYDGDGFKQAMRANRNR